MLYLFTFVRCQRPHNRTILKGQNGPLPLFSKKVSNILLFWKYIGSTTFFETRVCHEIRVPKTRVFWKNVLRKILKFFLWYLSSWNLSTIKIFQNFSMVLPWKTQFCHTRVLKKWQIPIYFRNNGRLQHNLQKCAIRLFSPWNLNSFPLMVNS